MSRLVPQVIAEMTYNMKACGLASNFKPSWLFTEPLQSMQISNCRAIKELSRSYAIWNLHVNSNLTRAGRKTLRGLSFHFLTFLDDFWPISSAYVEGSLQTKAS